MGYTTDFEGEFKLDKSLTKEHSSYLQAFSESRRMTRDVKITETFPDPFRLAVGLPIGEQSEYYVGDQYTNPWYLKDQERIGIIDYNMPPKSQPGLWCNWTPNQKDTAIVWNGAEKFYYYTEWLEYIINNFLTPWNYMLNGFVSFQGEDSRDKGFILVVNNKVRRIDSEHKLWKELRSKYRSDDKFIEKFKQLENFT